MSEGIGWRVTNDPVLDPTDSGMSIEADVTPALRALMTSGVTVVLDFRPTKLLTTFNAGIFTINAEDTEGAYLNLAYSPPMAPYNDVLRSSIATYGAPETEYSYDYSVLPGQASDVTENMLFRIVLTIDSAGTRISVNGRPTHAYVPTNVGSSAMRDMFKLVLTADDDIFPHPGYAVTIERAKFYAPQNAARMELMSAIN